MKIINKILSFIWRIWFVMLLISVTFFFSLFIILPLVLLKIDFKIIHQCMRVWSTIVYYGCGFWYEKLSDKKLDKNQSYIIVANHTSLMDIMLMFIVVKQPMVFVGKAELSKIPIFGHVFEQLNVSVDRKDSKSRAAVYRKVAEKIEEGKSVCIFPEGGVPDYDVFLDKFKDGPFALSIMLKAPMAVYTFCGMKQRLPYAYFKGGPGKVKVYLNEIIPGETYDNKQVQEYKERVYNSIYHRLEACQKK